MYRLIFLPLVCVFFSCSDEKEGLEPMYFDFKGFIENEMVDLGHKPRALYKTVTFNGVKETVELSPKADWWKRELSLFLKNDINRPAWRNRLNVDSVSIDEGYELVYSGDELMTLKSAKVRFRDDRPVAVFFERSSSNSYGQTTVYMNYIKNDGFLVQVNQVVNYINETHYEIEGRFK